MARKGLCIILYLRKFVHNAADLLDAHIVPMRWDVHNIWWVEFEWWSKFWHSWFPPMVRGTYEAFTSLDVWANIHVYGKQPFVLNVTVLFQICLLPGSSQHKNSSFDRYSVAFVLSTWLSSWVTNGWWTRWRDWCTFQRYGWAFCSSSAKVCASVLTNEAFAWT